MKINNSIKKFSQEKEQDPFYFESPKALLEEEAKETQAATARMDSIKELQSSVIEFSKKAESLKNKLSKTDYFEEFSKDRVGGKKFKNSFVGENADFTKWMSVMNQIGSAKNPGKPDGMFGIRTIRGINAIDVISGLFLDYFEKAGIPFAFDNSDKSVLTDCWQKNTSSDFPKQSAQYKATLASQITPIINKLNQAIDEVSKSSALDKFVKDDGKGGLTIGHSGKTESYLLVQNNIDKYKRYVWQLDVRRWTGKKDPVNIYITDVQNRTAFEDWKKRNSIKTNTNDQDALLISSIEEQFKK